MSTLAGTRIRAIRTARNLGQADLAERAGISPSYLNLIEHNRRRAGPRVLNALAKALDLDIAALDEKGETQALGALRDAAAKTTADPAPELERAEEFLGRFPGWAALLGALHLRAEAQERALLRLSDRMAHDPNLSAALLEIISAVTAVQSTAAILSESADMDPEWRGRFHRNIHGDSIRLANAADALVAYLDTASEDAALASPQEELESWLEKQDFHVPAVELVPDVDWRALTTGQPDLASPAGRYLARVWLTRAQADARALPLPRLVPFVAAQFVRAVTGDGGFSPEAIAQEFGTDLGTVFRRLAVLPPTPGLPRFGLLLSDASGTMMFRRPLDGFSAPRFGGGCSLWPLYQALLQPGRPLRSVIEVAGRPPARFLAHAIAQPQSAPSFDAPVILEAAMLITPVAALGKAMPAGQRVELVGSSCRVCPRLECRARREPSIVSS